MGVSDAGWMRHALEQARIAADHNEVPVGAVLIDAAGELIACGYNQPISAHDPSAHAEIVALRAAARKLGNYRLPDTTLYVTLEPCTMCVGALVHARVGRMNQRTHTHGALVHARVGRLVYGTTEPKTGAIESAQRLFDTGKFNHQPQIEAGVLAAECSALLTQFFENKRASRKQG